jgi:hypothetical protein
VSKRATQMKMKPWQRGFFLKGDIFLTSRFEHGGPNESHCEDLELRLRGRLMTASPLWKNSNPWKRRESALIRKILIWSHFTLCLIDSDCWKAWLQAETKKKRCRRMKLRASWMKASRETQEKKTGYLIK